MSKASTRNAPAGDLESARPLSEDRLALSATKGDRRAFAAIYKRYHQELYRYCTAILGGNSHDAQDALQNTMVKVMRALPGEQRHIQLKPWLYRIAHNEAVELLRVRRADEPIGVELVAPGSEPPQAAEHRERLRRLLVDLEDLPERQRGALLMRELGGLNFKQIGAALQTSPAVARQAVYEARLSLRRIGEGREMSCEAAMRALSGGDGRIARRREVRAHLRSCPDCRRFRDAIAERRRDLAALAPLPASVSAGLLHGILGGGSGSAGAGGAIGGAGVGAGKTLATSAVLKSAVTIAVVAVVGTSVADRGGLIHVGLPGGGSGGAAQSAEPARPSGTSRQAGAATHRTAASALRGRHAGRRRQATSAHRVHAGPIHSMSGVGHTEHLQSHPANQRQHGPARGLPDASSHGQQTAAAHRSTHLLHQGRSHPAHPATIPPRSHSRGSSDHAARQEPRHPEQAAKKSPAPSAPGPLRGQSAGAAGEQPAGPASHRR